VSKAFTNGLFY